ncbi:4Fe-4S dicluster domain-containing protein [Thermodesulfobacteriota bacterium]
MFFSVSLYISLAIFAFGLIFKLSTWFRYNLGHETTEFTTTERVLSAARGIILTIFSPKLFTLLKVLVLDVFFQVRTLRESRFRWLMHILIFWGFLLLFLMHGLEQFISAELFEDYASTINPFLFLRNLFALFVIAGMVLAFYRRFVMKIPRLVTSGMDHYVMILLAVIMVSGFLLEATKIGSHKAYQVMVEEYSDTDDEEELKSLESYWVHKFGVVSPSLKAPFNEDILAEGRELHETSCAACHSVPQWAPMSYGISRVIRPFALLVDRADLPKILLYIHFLACFIGLAYLPFSKMFHMIASPLSLLVNAVMDQETSDPANIATRQMMELDACTHCGTCSLQCSVGVCFEEIPNLNILPSEKIASVKALASGKKLTEEELKIIQDGIYLCTNCYKCTLACPVGINLQDLWFNVREALLARGYPEFLALSPLSFYRGLKSDELKKEKYDTPLQVARKGIDDVFRAKLVSMQSSIDQSQMNQEFSKTLKISSQSNTYSYCFTCMTCSNSCPVVWNYENPAEELGLLPHQIIRAAIYGLPEMIYSSNMLWRCLGCYQCQESCPQGVHVTDILYEIKNLMMNSLNGKKP